jgi:PAS domain S-box-containing protein
MEDIKNKRLIEELRFGKIALIEQNNSLQVLKDKAEKDLEQLKLIYNFSNPCCLVVDCNEKIVLINNNALILLLQTTKNVIGSPFDRYIVKKHLSNFKNFLRKAKQRKGNHSCNIELINTEGKHFSINLSGSFLENEQQFLLTVIDKTRSNLIKNEDLARKFLLKQAERIANIGTYKFAVSSGYVTISEELSLIFGFKFKKIYKIEKWVTIIHPEDRETITEYLQECIVTKKAFRREYRIIRDNDSEVRWVDGWGEHVFDDITQRFYLIGIIQDITERKLEEEQLMELNKQLKELNTLKSQFVSTVSHEFRTPLAGILSSVQLLKIYTDVWDKEKKEKMFKQIFDAVQHSTALLDDIALIDEEQTSKSFFRPTSIKLLPLIKEIIEENLSISGTIHEIVLKPDLSIESYTVDAAMIRHIFNNVISNAIKYSSETEKIVIFINEVASKKIKFEILDKGIGIPPDEIKNLSEPFYRASNVGKTKGTGFGFSIVKRFVALHKGQIAVESVLNQGTKVIITLPYL